MGRPVPGVVTVFTMPSGSTVDDDGLEDHNTEVHDDDRAAACLVWNEETNERTGRDVAATRNTVSNENLRPSMFQYQRLE